MAGRTNIYAVLLQGLLRRSDRDGLERLLDPLEAAIRRSSKLIKELPDDDSDYSNAMTDDECDQIEELLGIGFVVCQVAITSVASGVCRLHRYHKKISGRGLTSTTSKTVMKHVLPAVADGYTAIEILNASANYYKHRDEWPSWTELNRQQKTTASRIAAAGATEGSTGNLRTLAAALGNPKYSQMTGYCDVIEEWSVRLHVAYMKELTTLGLL